MAKKEIDAKGKLMITHTQDDESVDQKTRNAKTNKSIHSNPHPIPPLKSPISEVKSKEDVKSALVGKKSNERFPAKSQSVTCTSWRAPIRSTPSAIRSLEESIITLDSFHGYICREDLVTMLKKFGDYLVRISVHPAGSEKPAKGKKSGDSKHEKKKNRSATSSPPKDFIISAFCKETKNTNKGNQPIRNIPIRHTDGHFHVESSKTFKTLTEMFSHYKTNTGTIKGYDFQFLNGVSLTSWEFTHKDVELLEKKLGEGAFGEVRVGKIKLRSSTGKLVTVAVKMLKNAECITREQVSELLHEARVMRFLEHKNILRSYGIAVLQEPLYLMSELCNFGALREYLRDNAKTVTAADRINFCLGSARGVEYLHSQKFIHRDLAVRNVLLTEDKTPKVSDFGLAKATDRYEMKEACKIPVRYLAPETLDTFVFTSKTDVWSFGMVIWEIYENGQQPHDGKNAVTIKDLTKKNRFLKLNQIAPEPLRKLVSERIFVQDPENRCNMSVIVQSLEKLVK